MKPLPVLISLPHAGTGVPPEVERLNLLTPGQIIADGDGGADSIYTRLRDHVRHFVTTKIARAYVDLNRGEKDIRTDGVVKTRTCWGEPIYRSPLSPEQVGALIQKYHRPYHRKLEALAGQGVILGIDCHTMAETGPPVGPDTGQRRPHVCLGDVYGTSCPTPWTRILAECLDRYFNGEVRINRPFAGGWITRHQHQFMPWIQLELSRASFASDSEKGERVLKVLRLFCRGINPG
ncbi:MAG: N-formylglutamate amidohydrolase [Desulfobacterium sp.]|nr:N-formylglutamate amidohydrolase [Desulfobacterium sp.]